MTTGGSDKKLPSIGLTKVPAPCVSQAGSNYSKNVQSLGLFLFRFCLQTFFLWCTVGVGPWLSMLEATFPLVSWSEQLAVENLLHTSD